MGTYKSICLHFLSPDALKQRRQAFARVCVSKMPSTHVEWFMYLSCMTCYVQHDLVLSNTTNWEA